jgi:ABC-type branched-subunit amino acid transport system substrate-binding protein
MKKRILPAAAALLLLLAAGCATKSHVRPGEGGLPGPSLTDLKKPVTSDQYRESLAAIEGKDFTRKNAEHFMTVAQYRFNQGDFKGALETYQKVVAAATGGPANARAQYMVGHCYYEDRQYLPALSAFQKTQSLFPGTPGAQASRQMTDFVLQYALSTGELRTFLGNYPDSPARCTALFHLGRRESEEQMGGEAVADLNRFTQECPSHPSVQAANLLLADWQNRKQGQGRRVGVLVPRTGRLAALGASILNGVNLALDEARDGAPAGSAPDLTVSVKDTQGDSVAAVRAFKELVQEGGVHVVVGPVTKEEIGAVAPLANDLRIVFISPSASREGFSALGPYVFRNSMTNEMQGRAMARYATGSLGLKRFAVLSPEDGYGETLAQSFMQEVAARGGTVTAWHTYFPNTSDFKRPLLELGGFDPTDLKENERENDRRTQQLEYTLQKEVRKLLMSYSAASNTGNAVALVPLPEGLTNTACPSIAPSVRRVLQSALEESARMSVRKSDLVEQAVTRLPDDVRGTTLPAKAEDWADIMGEVQASLLLTGRIVETDPGDEWGRDDTWDFVIELEAWWAEGRSGRMRTLKSRVPYSLYKAPGIIRRPVLYEALYLPAHTREVSLLMTQIRFYDLSPVLLGGHLWEDRSVLKEGGDWPKGAYFVTGFHADSPDGDVQSFVHRYQKKYASKPDLLAAQAYDAMRLVLRASEGALSGEEARRRLSGINGFRGVSGETSFNGGGEAEKKVPVLKIENGRFQQVQ